MSLNIEVKDTTAWISKDQLNELGISPMQVLESLGSVEIKGKHYKITTLRDTYSGQEIK